MTALESMKRHEGDVTNPTAYLMSVLVNGVCEQDSGLILDLPPSYQKPSDFMRSRKGAAGMLLSKAQKALLDMLRRVGAMREDASPGICF